jgi:hypothetical protein
MWAAMTLSEALPQVEQNMTNAAVSKIGPVVHIEVRQGISSAFTID